MCGIAGIFGTDSGRETGLVARMLGELNRRGPDDAAIANWQAAVIGARRLATFDTTVAGRQPMVSTDGSIGVVLNGAIYNFRSLRDILTANGYTFRSESDTEVLLHGYREWGISQLVKRVEGMFAFAIWDNTHRKSYLVRDRLGIKPLVYTLRGGRIIFASTVKALRHAGIPDHLNDDAVLRYLNFGFVPEDYCIYQGFLKLRAGHFLEYSEKETRLTRYSDLNSPIVPIPFEEAVQETERLLLRSVELRLNSDVRVGALLSGGIDSALVCWAARALGADCPTFTLRVPDASDETAEAADTAKLLGVRNSIVPLSETSPTPTDLVQAFAEPFACTSALGMLSLSRHLKGRVSVVMTGDGGDEAFLGYPAHVRYWVAQNVARCLPDGTSDVWDHVQRFSPRKGLFGRAAHLLDFATAGLAGVMAATDKLEQYTANNILGSRLLDVLKRRQLVSQSTRSGRNLLTEWQTYHLANRFSGEFLTKLDGATSHESIEGRSPFLDQNLWAFANSVPVVTRLRRLQPKAILRQLAKRRIGRLVAGRRKRGFSVEVQRLLVTEWKTTAEHAFADSQLSRYGWMAPGLSWKELCSRASLTFDHLWFLLILELWLRDQKTVEGEPIVSLMRRYIRIPTSECAINQTDLQEL